MTGGWAAADVLDEFALAAVAGKWAGLYDVGFADGAFRAARLAAGPLLTADTIAGLDSAIRADYARWNPQ